MKFPFFTPNRSEQQPSLTSPTSATPPTRPASAVPARLATVTIQKPQPKPQPRQFTDAPSNIPFRFRSLIALVPDNFLAYPREELSRHIDLESFAQLPSAPILPQLVTAHISLPLVVILDALPPQLLANPLPATNDESVTLPLHEVVAQIPPQIFIAQLSPRSEKELQSITADIPAPFQERKPASAPVPVTPTSQPEPVATVVLAPVTPVVIAPTPAPAPMAVPEPVAAPVPLPVPVSASLSVTVAASVPEPATKVETGPLDEKKFLIDINRCSVEDLLSIKGIGPSLAQRIIEHRTQRGRFNSLDDLRQVPGVGRKTFRALAGTKAQSLNKLLGIAEDRELTLQEIVRHTGKLPGLQGCMLATSDGLFLAGELPPHLDVEAISVFAPQLFKRVTRYTKELKVGEARRFTLFTDEQPVSIFGADDVFLVVIHDRKHFSKRLLRQCERISQEIARLCRQRTTV